MYVCIHVWQSPSAPHTNTHTHKHTHTHTHTHTHIWWTCSQTNVFLVPTFLVRYARRYIRMYIHACHGLEFILLTNNTFVSFLPFLPSTCLYLWTIQQINLVTEAVCVEFALRATSFCANFLCALCVHVLMTAKRTIHKPACWTHTPTYLDSHSNLLGLTLRVWDWLFIFL